MRILLRLVDETMRICAAVYYWIGDYYHKKLMRELNKAPQKTGNKVWDEYIDRSIKRTYQRGTRKGKRGVKNFARGLTIRANSDIKDYKQFNESMTTRYAICEFYFYKWLAEIPGFDPDANELMNVPIMTLFETDKKNFRYITNMGMGSESLRHTRCIAQLKKAVRRIEKMRVLANRKRRKVA